VKVDANKTYSSKVQIPPKNT